jgi:hypothetical protein
MEYTDFLQLFELFDICHVYPDILANFRLECEMDNLQKSTWTSCIFEGHMSTKKDRMKIRS